MATYYVRADGNDTNTGLGSSPGQAWATITKALGATGITGGDTLYIAPGTYRGAVTVGGTYTSTTYIYGNPTASLFVGVSAGEVRITPSGNDNAISTSYAITATSKNNLNFRDLVIGGMLLTTCSNTVIERCYLHSTSATTEAFFFAQTTYTNYNTNIRQCVIVGTVYGIRYWYIFGGSPYTTGFYVSDSVIIANTSIFLDNQLTFQSNGPSGFNFYNCVIIGSTTFQMTSGSYTGGGTVTNSGIFNSLLYATGSYVFNGGPGFVENYNRIYGVNTRITVTQGANTTVASWPGLEFGQSLLQGFGPIQIFGNTLNSPNSNAGIGLSAPLVDMYGFSWDANPDIGVAKYRTLNGIGSYLPSSQINLFNTIIPGSTNQSIELSLGATGIATSTPGLSIRYNRSRSASVNIPLVARTITQPWISGGFAEVDSVNMPGIYRLDIPNEALVSGADDVTIVAKGTSATNSALVTIKLSGVASIAAEVWNPNVNDFTLPNSFGARVVQTTADNRDVNVTAGNQIQIDNEQTFYPTAGQDLDAITEDVGRWTLRNNVLTLYAPDGTYLRRVRLSALGITL
jgi:hypothetical protein